MPDNLVLRPAILDHHKVSDSNAVFFPSTLVCKRAPPLRKDTANSMKKKAGKEQSSSPAKRIYYSLSYLQS